MDIKIYDKDKDKWLKTEYLIYNDNKWFETWREYEDYIWLKNIDVYIHIGEYCYNGEKKFIKLKEYNNE